MALLLDARRAASAVWSVLNEVHIEKAILELHTLVSPERDRVSQEAQ